MPILNPKNFQSDRYEFSVKNTLSGTEILQPELVQLLEISEVGVTLSLPANSCAEGHALLVEMKILSEGAAYSFPFSAVVEQIVRDKSPTISAKLRFRQYNAEEWKSYLSRFEAKSKETANLFDRIKGRD